MTCSRADVQAPLSACSVWEFEFLPQEYFAGSGCSRIQYDTQCPSMWWPHRGQLGTSQHCVSPLALGAGASSRSWEGFTSTETGVRRTAPRITNPSGTVAAGCSHLSRWVTPLPAWGTGSWGGQDAGMGTGTNHRTSMFP